MGLEFDSNRPYGTETVSVADDYIRETRQDVIDFANEEHNLSGTHKIPSRTTAGLADEVPTGGRLVYDSTVGALMFGTGSAWVPTNGELPPGGSPVLPFELIGGYSDLTAAIAAIGSVNKTVLVIDEATALSGNTTVPSNILLQFMGEGKVALGNYNLTLNGDVLAGRTQIFDYTGSGRVLRGSTASVNLFPEWWGAKADGATNDYTAFSYALTFAGTTYDSSIELAPGKTYFVRDTLLTIPASVDFIFNAGSMIKLLNHNIVFSRQLNAPARLLFVYTGTGVAVTGVDGVTCEAMWFPNILTDAITFANSKKVTINVPSMSIAADLTIPATITLRLARGNLLSIATTKTLTINGSVEAGLWQIFSCAGTGKVVFNPANTMQVYPEWWADNTTPGVTDMTAAVNAAALAHPVVKFQSTIYRFTASIVVGKVRLTGFEVIPMTTGGSSPTLNAGTWFFFDHTGRGISMTTEHGSTVEKFGTYRTQPTPASTYPTAWTPTAHDYDIYTADKYDITIRDLVLLNPTKAIYAGGTVGGGRINITNIKGQPFQKGIVFDQCWDVCKVDQIHFWPFWSLSNFGSITTNQCKNVSDYTMANLDSFQFFKCDGPRLTNIFTICAKSGVRFSKNAYDIGVSVLGQATNVYFDQCKYGIWVDNTCSSGQGPAWQFSNLVITGIHPIAGSIVGSKGIFCEGMCNHQISTLFAENFGLQIIHASAANAVIRISDARMYNYDQDATNCAALTMANGSILTLDGKPIIGNSGGSGGFYDEASGIIYVDDWRTWVPVPYAASGSTTFGTCTGKKKLMPTVTHIEVRLPVTSKGTGGGSIVVPLPVASDGWWSGSARNGVNGKICNFFTTNESVAYINDYNNLFPIAADGDWIQGTLAFKQS